MSHWQPICGVDAPVPGARRATRKQEGTEVAAQVLALLERGPHDPKALA